MNKKYEITDKSHPQYPWLHRIRALRDVSEDVLAGDYGGFIQAEENLSHDGRCWITNDAIAAEGAHLSCNATMWDFSCAKGSATISGEARITDNAIIDDYAIVSAGCIGGTSHVVGNAEIYANGLTGQAPIVEDEAFIYGTLGGHVIVNKNTVILPGWKIDNPTTDGLHVYPNKIVVERTSKGTAFFYPHRWAGRGIHRSHQ